MLCIPLSPTAVRGHSHKGEAKRAVVSTLDVLCSGVSICVPFGRSLPYTILWQLQPKTRLEGSGLASLPGLARQGPAI